MPREKRFFVAFTEVFSTGEDQQEHSYHQHREENPRPIEVMLSCEEEHPDWIRDCAQQERQRLGQQSEVSNAVTRMVRALHRKC